jgi:hypothetical protein
MGAATFSDPWAWRPRPGRGARPLQCPPALPAVSNDCTNRPDKRLPPTNRPIRQIIKLRLQRESHPQKTPRNTAAASDLINGRSVTRGPAVRRRRYRDSWLVATSRSGAQVWLTRAAPASRRCPSPCPARAGRRAGDRRRELRHEGAKEDICFT